MVEFARKRTFLATLLFSAFDQGLWWLRRPPSGVERHRLPGKGSCVTLDSDTGDKFKLPCWKWARAVCRDSQKMHPRPKLSARDDGYRGGGGASKEGGSGSKKKKKKKKKEKKKRKKKKKKMKKKAGRG